MRVLKLILFIVFIFPLWSNAKLSVQMAEPKTVGNKSIIKLTLKNDFTKKIESARAVIFLINDVGKVVGQATKWVIGGTKSKPALEPGATTTFNFVVSSDKEFTKTKISFSRIILEGGKLVDASKNTEIVR